MSQGEGVAVVFGTRPEIIKLAPVIAALGEASRPVFTGQHYDAELTSRIFTSCGMPDLQPALAGIGGVPRGVQVSAMIGQLTRLFTEQRPAAVIVQGDTNSTNAGAQAANYLGIPLVHVEAGLRSHDRGMPEEINRLLVSVLADAHCCATAGNVQALLDGATAAPETVHLTGNPVVEAVRELLPGEAERTAVASRLGIPDGAELVLATIHRPENTDDPDRLRAVLRSLELLAQQGMHVALPLHPRTRNRMAEAGVRPGPGINLLLPLDYRDFLALAARARVLVSDSGGLQEEVSVLRVPLVVVRTSTERPESVSAGFSLMSSPEGIITSVQRLLGAESLARIANAPSPFGDGHASCRIARISAALAGISLDERHDCAPLLAA